MSKVTKSGSISLKDLLPHIDLSSVNSYSCEILEDGRILLKLFDETGTEIKELPTKKRVRATKTLAIMVSNATNRCFAQAESECPPGSNREIVSHAYRQKLCHLETDVLEAIVVCHNKNLFRRANITLAAISNELTRRALLGDSSRK